MEKAEIALNASPRRLTPREEADIVQIHETHINTIRSLLISARGDTITPANRSAIDRLLSLAKPGTDDLNELLQLDQDIKARVSMNVGAPKLLLEQQARLDSENILVLEKQLAHRLVPLKSSGLAPPHDHRDASHDSASVGSHSNPDEAHIDTVSLSSTDLSEFEELEREAARAKIEVSVKAEFMEALTELEERSAVILKIASGQVPLSDLQLGLPTFELHHANCAAIGDHHSTQLSVLTIAWPDLQLKAFANWGMFESGPFTRQRGSECGFV